MTELEDVISPNDLKEMSTRADARANIAYVARMQWEELSEFRDTHLAIVCRSAADTGLTDTEIQQVIDETRDEMRW